MVLRSKAGVERIDEFMFCLRGDVRMKNRKSIIMLSMFLAMVAPQAAQSADGSGIFTKCQVFHNASVQRPACPSGWEATHAYTDSCIDHLEAGNQNSSGRSLGTMTKDTEADAAWCFQNGTYGSGGLRKQSTYSCTVCRKK